MCAGDVSATRACTQQPASRHTGLIEEEPDLRILTHSWHCESWHERKPDSSERRFYQKGFEDEDAELSYFNMAFNTCALETHRGKKDTAYRKWRGCAAVGHLEAV